MADRQRNDSGQFSGRVTLEAVLSVFEAVDGPAITSSDVAEILDCSTEAARQKLTRLVDRGEVDCRKTGRTTIYWRIGPEQKAIATGGLSGGSETTEEAAQPSTKPQGSADRDRGSKPADGSELAEHSDGTADDEITAALDGFEPGRNQAEREPRREIAREVLQWLRDHSELARKGEIVDALYESTALEDQKEDTWWEKTARAALQHAADRGFVDREGRRYAWRVEDE